MTRAETTARTKNFALLHAMEEAKLTATDLACKTRLSLKTIENAINRRRIYATTAVKIAVVLGKSVEDLKLV